MMKGIPHYRYAGLADPQGYHFRLRLGPARWKGFLFRFRDTRARDAWVAADAHRRIAFHKLHPAVECAKYIREYYGRGEWRPTGDQYGSELWQCSKDSRWAL